MCFISVLFFWFQNPSSALLFWSQDPSHGLFTKVLESLKCLFILVSRSLKCPVTLAPVSSKSKSNQQTQHRVNELQWTSMIFNGFQWFSMRLSGAGQTLSKWFPTEVAQKNNFHIRIHNKTCIGKSSLDFLEIWYWIPTWIFIDFQWFHWCSLIFNAFQWFTMIFNDFQ